MILKKLSLTNYRNIESAEIEFSPQVNILYGDNAQGKTNLLEAIYSFARGKSFRSAKDADIVMFGRESYFCSIVYEDCGYDNTLDYRFAENCRIRRKNKIKIDKASDIIGNFRAVFFCPDHLSIIKGEPSRRREFLDIAVAQGDRAYVKALSAYRRAVENRNAILKNYRISRTETDEIRAWGEISAANAAEIHTARKEYVSRLSSHMNAFISEMGGECAVMNYKSDIKEVENREQAEAEYKKLFTENIAREREAKTTLFGVHRDDFGITLDGKDARHFASQGQQRSLALALKLGEGEISFEKSGSYPVFLFDDVLSELDENRRRFMLSKLVGRQIIITSCERELFAAVPDVKIIKISKGRLETAEA